MSGRNVPVSEMLDNLKEYAFNTYVKAKKGNDSRTDALYNIMKAIENLIDRVNMSNLSPLIDQANNVGIPKKVYDDGFGDLTLTQVTHIFRENRISLDNARKRFPNFIP
jgi:hypothetical protein